MTSAPASRAPATATSSTLRFHDSRRVLPAKARIFAVVIIDIPRKSSFYKVVAQTVGVSSGFRQRSHLTRVISAFRISNLFHRIHHERTVKYQRAFGRRAAQ